MLMGGPPTNELALDMKAAVPYHAGLLAAALSGPATTLPLSYVSLQEKPNQKPNPPLTQTYNKNNTLLYMMKYLNIC